MAKIKKTWTESDVYAMLEKTFPGPAYAMLSQVRNGTGFERRKNRTADAVAISCYPSRGLYMAGIEIKVSRPDWMKELADPTKADAIQKYCKYWYVAAPKGLIDVGEVPETWGLIECSSTARIVKPAPMLEPEPPDMLLVCSILRNAATSMVPAERLQKRIQNDREMSNRDIEDLRERIAKFEISTGVKIDDAWESRPIGDAAKDEVYMSGETRAISLRRVRPAR